MAEIKTVTRIANLRNLAVDPLSSNGTQDVKIGLAGTAKCLLDGKTMFYSGRDKKTLAPITIHGTTAEVNDVTVPVEVKGAGLILDLPTTISVDKDKTGIVIEGLTNSKKLRYTVTGTDAFGTDESGQSNVKPSATWLAPDISASPINNQAGPLGDPGAESLYRFSIGISFPANATGDARSFTTIIQGSSDTTHTPEKRVVITQAGQDPQLSVSEGTTISLEPTGADVTITILSNTNWQIL